jgi:hypothetical protein
MRRGEKRRVECVQQIWVGMTKSRYRRGPVIGAIIPIRYNYCRTLKRGKKQIGQGGELTARGEARPNFMGKPCTWALNGLNPGYKRDGMRLKKVHHLFVSIKYTSSCREGNSLSYGNNLPDHFRYPMR